MSAPGKWFRLLFPDACARRDAWDLYVHWKSLYSLGESEVGFFRATLGFQSLVVYYLGADNILAKFGVHLALGWWWLLIVPALLCFKLGLYVGIGLFWDSRRMPHRFQRWGNQRNEMLKSISEAIGNGKLGS